MSTKAIIGLILGIVVVGGGAWYLSSHNAAPVPADEQGDVQTLENGDGTLGALLGLAGSLTCTVTMPTPGGESTGTLFISNGQMRSDVTTAVNGKEIAAHMIKNGDYFYSWTDAYPQGVKIKLAATASGNGQAGYDPNQKVKYSCTPWAADASKFTVPANVTFTDMSAGTAGVKPSPY